MRKILAAAGATLAAAALTLTGGTPAQAAEVSAASDRAHTVVSADITVMYVPGSATASRPVTPRRAIGRDEAVRRLVAAAGATGMTVREVAAATGLHHGQASGALSRLHTATRLARLDERRDRCRVYVAR